MLFPSLIFDNKVHYPNNLFCKTCDKIKEKSIYAAAYGLRAEKGDFYVQKGRFIRSTCNSFRNDL